MQVIETEAGRIRITTQMSARWRLAMFAAAVIPLLVPYFLIVRSHWWSGSAVMMLLAVVATLGALSLTLVLGFVAVLAEKRDIEFDGNKGRVRFAIIRLMLKPRVRTIDFADIVRLEIVDHNSDDLQSSYDISMVLANGPKIEFGEFESSAEIGKLITQIYELMEQKPSEGSSAIGHN